MSLGSDLGLDIIRQVVGVVAREALATRGGLLGFGRVHELDAVLVVGINNGRDIEVGEAHPAAEEQLTEHTRLVVGALGNGVEVTLVVVRELNSGVLSVVDGDGLNLGTARRWGEDNLASDIVQGLEGNRSSVDSNGSGSEAEERSSEMHLDCLLKVTVVVGVLFLSEVDEVLVSSFQRNEKQVSEQKYVF